VIAQIPMKCLGLILVMVSEDMMRVRNCLILE
jgi:hypothetical protein